MSVATRAVARKRRIAGGEDASEVRTEADRLEALGDRICRLSAHIDAAQRELLTLVAEFDRLGGWKAGGHRSCAKWLTLRTGRAPGRAREQVRVARALEDLPRTGEAMGRGRLSFDQARTLTRVADAETEDDLLELAEGATIGQLRRMARAWKKGTREDEAARERKRHRRRRFSVFPDDDGMGVPRGKLMPEVGAVFKRALEVRDRGCRFPGCGLRFCQAHHIDHWADGGPTSLENTLLLCRFHHRLVHEEGWTVQWWGRTRAVFTDPRGNHHLDERPEPPEVPAEPARALIRENRRRGVDPGPLEAGARWKRERDIPDRVYFGALEAGFAARPPP